MIVYCSVLLVVYIGCDEVIEIVWCVEKVLGDNKIVFCVFLVEVVD